MTNKIAKIEDPTEALLQGLIAECHAIIRNDIVPMARQVPEDDRLRFLDAVNDLMKSAVLLADAVGRLRGTAPVPEIRQRITVERVEKLAPPTAG